MLMTKKGTQEQASFKKKTIVDHPVMTHCFKNQGVHKQLNRVILLRKVLNKTVPLILLNFFIFCKGLQNASVNLQSAKSFGVL